MLCIAASRPSRGGSGSEADWNQRLWLSALPPCRLTLLLCANCLFSLRDMTTGISRLTSLWPPEASLAVLLGVGRNPGEEL